MRRLLSILLGLCLGLGPALAAVPANALAMAVESALTGKSSAEIAEASLPACCRRHGVHHCALHGTMALGDAAGQTTLSAADCCPCWPHALASAATPFAALAAEDEAVHVAVARCSDAAALDVPTLRVLRKWPRRGPPAFEVL
jgi:hypothetical protein